MSLFPSLLSPKAARTGLVLLLVVGGFATGWWGQQMFAPDKLIGEHVPLSAPSQPNPMGSSKRIPSHAPESDKPLTLSDIAVLLDEAEDRGERILPAHTVITHFSQRPIDFQGKISDAAAALLQLTPSERAAADRAIKTTSERLQQLELARLELAAVSDSEVVFAVGAFADEGEAAQTAYRENLLRELDPEAADLLWELTTKDASYNGFWKGWGEEAKEIRFAIEPNEHRTDDYQVSFGTAEAGTYTAPEGRRLHGFKTMTNHHTQDTWSTYGDLAGRHQYLTHHLPEPLRSWFHEGSTREGQP